MFAHKDSADWMRHTHILEGNTLSSKSTDCKCESHLQNTFTTTSKLVSDQTPGNHSLPHKITKLPHKINLRTLLKIFYCGISLNPHNNRGGYLPMRTLSSKRESNLSDLSQLRWQGQEISPITETSQGPNSMAGKY